ncbi:MAG: hypothetical protein QW270_03415 [Candidatus Bathyarchaeia archaeon]
MKRFIVLLLCFGLMANVSAVSNSGLGVEGGDWIRYVVQEGASGVEYQQKMEFLNVTEMAVTANLTVYMSGGTAYSQQFTVDLASQEDSQMTPFSFRVYFIPVNLTNGESVYLGNEFANKTIDGEMTRAYAGADRRIVYSNFSQGGNQYTFYWDMETGVLVEGCMSSGVFYKDVLAVETNMWGKAEFEWWIFAMVITAVICGILTSKFRKKSKRVNL